MANKPALHALFIGIDAYNPNIAIGGKYCFQPLKGCVRDAKALQELLAKDPDFEFRPMALHDKDATKANIVAAFRQHLSQAKPGDTVFIFYSGHGAVEVADTEVWADEKDGRLEGLACWYEQGDSGKFILADKELRYLLHEISKPGVHVAALFDCCHSGDNTRAAVEETIVRKQALVEFPQRQWADFVFSEKFKRADFIGKKTSDLLPEGRYVQLAASESNEAASEAHIGGEAHGVFAYYLLDILRQSGGHLSYRDLTNRIRNRIRFKYGQRTKIYAPPAAAEMTEQGFLQKKLPDLSTGHGTVDYNLHNSQYRLNRGILDRVASGQTLVRVQTPDGKTHEGRAGTTDLNTAEVVFDAATLPQLPTAAMSATLEKLASRPLRIHLLNKDLPDNEADALAQQIFSAENENFLTQESEESRADYTLLFWGGMYYLTEKGDWFRPVVLPVLSDDSKAAKTLLGYLLQMAQWHFLKDLQNTTADSLIPASFLRLEFTDAQGQSLVPQNDVLVRKLLSTSEVDDRGRAAYETQFKLRLTNNGPRDLYVAAMLLMDYGCYANLVTNPSSARVIEPSKSEDFEFGGEKTMTLELSDATRLFNHPHGSSTLKFIFALAPFEVNALDMEPLPMPDLLNTRKNVKIPRQNNPQTLPATGWNTLNIELRTINPEFETPDLTVLKEHLDEEHGNPYLAHFLTGLYFEKKPGTTASLDLKADLTTLEKSSFFWGKMLDTANYWANWRRNRRYKDMAKKYPDLPKIVSEGDSWFQHPMLDDIIDNVGRTYPTYCTAAAGDTIRNYFAAGELMESVRKIQPAVLLLSGGGNDILGEDMPKFLQQYTPGKPGKQPERFFSPAFTAELNDIADIYRTIFEHFKTERPDMPIITHSYDYPRPVEPDSKERNWLGQYFDGKGIKDPLDRKAAVHYMMKQFNIRLKNLTDDYPGQVFYLDVRDSVRDGQWDDEIHPNNHGFQNVAAQFLRQISAVLRKP